MQCAVSNVEFELCSVQFVVSVQSVWNAVFSGEGSVCIMHLALCSIKCTLYSVQLEPINLQCVVFHMLRAVLSTHFALFSV